MQEILSNQARELIIANPLFSNLTENQLGELMDMMYEERVNVGVNIVQEGEPGDALYIIRSGCAEVLKKDDRGDYHHIAMLKAGDVLGEISLLDDRPRSATVRAVEATQLIGLKFKDLKAKSKPETSVENILKVNFAKSLSQNIRQLNTRSVNKLKDQLKFTRKQNELGQYVFRMMALLVLYVLSTGLFHSFIDMSAATGYLTLPVFLLFGYGFYHLIRHSGFALKTFGVTLEGAGASIKDGLLLSVLIIMPLIILYKMLIVSSDPASAGAPILFYPGFLANLTAQEITLLALAFALYAPVYEFIVRGVCQTSFMMFLTDKNRRWQAIALAALFFSLSSVDVSLKFAACLFALNIFWGWLYTRHSSLAGVIVSHWLIGYFGIFVVGFNF